MVDIWDSKSSKQHILSLLSFLFQMMFRIELNFLNHQHSSQLSTTIPHCLGTERKK